QGTAATTFVYNAFGHLVAEYEAAAPAPGSGGPKYLTADHLGSIRVVTDAAGGLIVRHDYLPFGEEIPSTYGGRSAVPGYGAADSASQRFTGKELDAESGLDYFLARYSSGAQARFTSPDPLGGRQEGPQTLNKYSYTRNNPLTLTDPTGLDFNL